MQRLACAILAISSALSGVAYAQNVTDGGGTSSGSGIIADSAFPGSPSTNDLILITDDTVAGACDSGGGSARTLCVYDGADWQPVNVIAEADTLDTVFDRGKEVNSANSFANSFRVVDANGDGFAIYTDPTNGPTFVCIDNNVENACTSYTRTLASGQTVVYKNSGGTTIFSLAEAGTLTLGATLIKTSQPLLVPLNPRGAATGGYESIVTNQPSDYYLTVTDANTDAADFSFSVTAELAGKTTATFRLLGVSKNASPANNIDFDCAMSSYTPGTDTFAAHVTTGEVTALLTPATQNRPVAVTTSSHTINGGALVAGDVVHGSCEVDATATTSAQMTDFRLWGWVLITLN